MHALESQGYIVTLELEKYHWMLVGFICYTTGNVMHPFTIWSGKPCNPLSIPLSSNIVANENLKVMLIVFLRRCCCSFCRKLITQTGFGIFNAEYFSTNFIAKKKLPSEISIFTHEISNKTWTR